MPNLPSLPTAALVTRFADAAVLIVGDVMLDEYIWGEVRRISPEAPVPVVEALRRTYAPGGAANVALNVAALGGLARLGGLVGQDYAAGQLRAALELPRLNTEGLIPEPGRPTTTKTRVVAHSQQMVRVDSEQRHPIDGVQEAALLQWAEANMASVGACVLSDYSKGVISPRVAQSVIALANRHGKPTIVDPKGTDYAKYRGATLIKPNLHETERVLNRDIRGDDALLNAARDLREILAGSALLITRGAEGMTLFETQDSAVHIPQKSRDVYDVTGAGDTVVSTLALALACGSGLEQAARLANLAGGIVVGKLGTASVTSDELRRELA